MLLDTNPDGTLIPNYERALKALWNRWWEEPDYIMVDEILERTEWWDTELYRARREDGFPGPIAYAKTRGNHRAIYRFADVNRWMIENEERIASQFWFLSLKEKPRDGYEV